MKEKIILMNKEIINRQAEEHYNRIRTNIQFSGSDMKTILITSSKESEGKSSVSLNLAVAFAKIGANVLLIDADIRNSVLVGRVKAKQRINGLTSYLSGVSTIEETIYGTDVENLDIIPSGKYSPNPTNLLQNSKIDKMLEIFKEVYDYIIIDTAPIGLVVDAAILAKKCDGAILVTEAGRIQKKELKKAKQDIELTGIKFLGIILNKVDESILSYGHYGGYGRYGN
ncbi:MAG: polysaccharide biosynthesis tyrosine autokinase [Clostridium sp.]